ncbi:MAG: aldo/keto reductase [Candidatus Brockarchaeota archaeon]|nr:aldo/keto reductase [Candidatus Brockarchaeota archaeon]MBO3767966.1 aldo/keto reductase [Candidatus Brockarchaeota archaeon]MBO3801818.1 aldo/keto reductase [Candidatus Brockarchaeota archaeon]
MRFVELGKTGIRVSMIGIGTWQWGAKEWGYEKSYSEIEVRKAFKAIYENEINFIDTAEMYAFGKSEKLVGEMVREYGRENFVIATKVSPWHLDEKSLEKACQGSLERLGIKEIDLYQVHWPNPLVPISKTMKALEKLLNFGKIRAIGVSNFNLKQLSNARKHLEKNDIASDQVLYNMLSRNVEKDLIPYAQKEKITLIAYSPLAQGLLSGKITSSYKPKEIVRKINPLFSKSNIKKLETLNSVLQNIAKSKGKTVTQVVLSWTMRHGCVVPIPGVKNDNQVRDVAESVSISLSNEELNTIELALKNTRVNKLLGYLEVILNFT